METRGTWVGLVLGLLLCALAAGCVGSEQPEAAQQAEYASDVPVLGAELGGSYDLSVEAKAAGAETTGRHANVLRFRVGAGESFAAVMRRTDDSDLDPYLALFTANDGAKVAVSDYSQALLPMAGEDDGVVVYTSVLEQDFLLFAADLDLTVTGSFQVDLVSLGARSTSVDLGVTNPGTRKLAELLRDRELDTEHYLAIGGVSEGDDGLLATHPKAMPSLLERVALLRFAKAVNDLRSTHFSRLVSDDLGEQDAGLAAEVGALCGALWRDLRSDSHALR